MPAMNNLSHVYRTSPDIRFRLVGDEAVVLRQAVGEVIVINDSGAMLLEMLKSGVSMMEMVDALTNEFEVDTEAAADDVRIYLDALTVAGVVEIYKQEGVASP